jgi:hypothetical protein
MIHSTRDRIIRQRKWGVLSVYLSNRLALTYMVNGKEESVKSRIETGPSYGPTDRPYWRSRNALLHPDLRRCDAMSPLSLSPLINPLVMQLSGFTGPSLGPATLLLPGYRAFPQVDFEVLITIQADAARWN